MGRNLHPVNDYVLLYIVYFAYDGAYYNLVAGSDLVEWKETADHNVSMYDDRLSSGTCRADRIWIDETGCRDNDVTGACAEYEDQIQDRLHIHSG